MTARVVVKKDNRHSIVSNRSATRIVVGSQAPSRSGAPAGFQMIYSTTTTDSDPGDGKFRLNHATIASATAMYIDNVDASGNSITAILDKWDDSTSTVRGVVRLEKEDSPSVWAEFNVTGSVVDGTGYRKITLATGATGAAFANNDVFRVTFTRTGDIGDVASATAFTADNRLVRTDRPTSDNKNIQITGIVVDDSDNMSGPASASFATYFRVGSTTPPANTTAGDSTVRRLFVGNNAAVTMAASAVPPVQVHGTSADTVVIANARWSADTTGAVVIQGKSRGAAVGTRGAVASSDVIGNTAYEGDDGTNFVRAVRLRAVVSGTVSSGVVPAKLDIATMTAAGALTVGMTMENDQGVTLGSPTGGSKGLGTLNAVGVYDDNTLLTCMALQRDFLENGKIDLDYWDSVVPDLVVPESKEEVPVTVEKTREIMIVERSKEGDLIRKLKTETYQDEVKNFDPVWDEHGNGVDVVETTVVEEVVTPARTVPRIHRTARLFKQMIDDGFDPRDPEMYFSKLKADEALPGMPTKAEWVQGALSIGEQFSRKWLAMEMLAIVANVMWGKLKDHEARILRLERAGKTL